MKRSLRAAIEAEDIARVRGIILDALRRKPGSKETLEAVRLAMTSVDGIFDEDKEPLYMLPPEEWNESYAVSLDRALLKSFTSERLAHYTEVVVALAAKREEGATTDASLSASSATPAEGENVEVRAAGLAEILLPEDVKEITEESGNSPVKSGNKRSATKIFGYILILLGAAAAIVGMCVPAHFIIGLGIGTLMIGSAVAYIGISASTNKGA